MREAGDGLTDRERAYRGALRWYPARWRDAHGEALIGALPDQDDARGRRRPGARDRLAIARQGLRRRSGLGRSVLSVVATVGLVVIAFGVFAPTAAIDLVSPHPAGGGTDPSWIPVAGGVLAGASASALLLVLTRGSIHLASRSVALALIGTMSWFGGASLRVDRTRGAIDPGFTVYGRGLLPLGWGRAMRMVVAPALTVAGASTVGVCIVVLLLCAVRTGRARLLSAAPGRDQAHEKPSEQQPTPGR